MNAATGGSYTCHHKRSKASSVNDGNLFVPKFKYFDQAKYIFIYKQICTIKHFSCLLHDEYPCFIFFELMLQNCDFYLVLVLVFPGKFHVTALLSLYLLLSKMNSL